MKLLTGGKKYEITLLEHLAGGVEATRKINKKLHEVRELFFDWKDRRSNEFVWHKLDYMHNNSCRGKRQLAVNAIEYIHSIARFI